MAAKEALGYMKVRKDQKSYWWDEDIETDMEEKRKKQKILNIKNEW